MSCAFVSTREVVERIKDIISHEVRGFVLDKDVANMLKMSSSALGACISRDALPLRQIVMFCYKREINIREILF